MRLCYLFIFLFIFASSTAQEYIVNVQQIGLTDGLASRQVLRVFNDKDGFLWVTGNNYLQRYDGYEFKSYNLDTPKGKIKTIYDISQNKEGWLRISANYQGDRWQRDIIYIHPISGEKTTKEKVFSSPISAQLDTLLNALKIDKYIDQKDKNKIHFKTADHIISCDFETKQLDSLRLTIQRNFKNKIRLIDHNDNYWITEFRKAYILKVSKDQTTIDTIFPIVKDHLPLEDIFELDDEIYLIGNHPRSFLGKIESTNKGQDHIYRVTKKNQLASTFKAPIGYHIFTIFDNRIWCIGEIGWKVYALSGKLEFELKREEYGDALFKSIEQTELVKGQTGKVYMGTDLGLNIIDIKKNPFNTYLTKEENELLTLNNATRGICETAEETLINIEYGSLVNGGLIRIPKSNLDTFIIQEDNSYVESATHSYVGRPILPDNNGNIWVGERGYARKWSPDFKRQEKVPLSGDFYVWSLFNDEDNCVWIGGENGLTVACEGQSATTEYLNRAIGIEHDQLKIYQIQADKKGLLWLSTEYGIYVFDRAKNKTIKHYHSKGIGKEYLPADIIHHLYIDEEGDKWLGTANGLIFWNSTTNKKKLLTRNDGLSNEVIYAIIEDEYQRLWLSSDYGIMSFDKNTSTVRTYLPKHGISDQEFNRISHFRAKDGTIYFGGLNGVTSFHPKDFIDDEPNYQAVAIADYEIFDGEESKLLNKTIELLKTKTITLRPDDRYFKLNFVLPAFDGQEKTIYGWKMTGVYDDWNYQNKNSVQFSALPYGQHELRIKGQSANGGWSPNELVLNVKVLKPFYLQIWFLILTVLSSLFVIWRYIAYRDNKLLKDKKRLQQEINVATLEIKDANLKIQKDKNFIEQQAEELKKLDQLKSRFFANISHELRTPLSLMIGPVKHLLKNGNHTPEDTKMLEFVKRNSLHLKELVNEILDLSKLENNKMELQESPVQFYDYVKQHLAQFYSFGDSETIIFSASFPENGDINILVDKNKFEKIINNFLSNAMKFTPRGGKVTLSVAETGENIHLEIQDTGRGIHPEDLPHIFDRFYQSTQVDAPTEGGTGIGLSLCWELAELMGGSIKAESILGKGSTFHLYFPKKEAILEKIANSNVHPIAKNISSVLQKNILLPCAGATILIAEDNADLRSYYEIILSDYNLILTENGQVALAYLASAKTLPSLIISDLMMPIMDGLQFLTQLKSSDKWRHLPVIMLTAKTNMAVKIEALRIGIDDYITKPFNDEELLVRIENLLSHSKSRIAYVEEKEKSSTLTIVSEEDKIWLSSLEVFVGKHLKNNLLTVNWLATQFTMSESSMFRQIKRLTGLSPSKYIQEFRLDKAKQLLENHIYNSVSQVAFEVGFQDAKYFTRTFKGRYGKAPSTYLRDTA